MQKIVPNLWCDHNAAEVVEFYTSIFLQPRVLSTLHYPTEGLPDFQQEFAGELLTIDFEICGLRLVAINAGPEFRPNPAISFMVNFDPATDPLAAKRINRLWRDLILEGTELMALQEYDFSKRYGWVEDKFGVSWQLILSDPGGDPRPTIMPSLLFCGPQQNRAEQAIDFYRSVFHETGEGMLVRYSKDSGPATTDSVVFADFRMAGQWFAAADSAFEQDFTFGNGISLELRCHDQAEIDYYWGLLSTVPEAEQCGWCVDAYGVSWQIVPDNIAELIKKPGAYQAMLEMKKIEIAGF